MYTLLFLEPGHFHAALTLREKNPRVDPTIHLYAGPGLERESFIALVHSFNARDEQPTNWSIRVHEPSDPERALIEERRGGVVVLAGQNQPKLATIARLHAAGLHVLADKPWLTDSAALPNLEQVTASWPLAMDIMTARHDAIARLAQMVVADTELFGALDGDTDEPAIDIHSVHHLLKEVNGALLRRPSWYYDTRIQGDGIVDIQSHMVDQAQWLVGDGPGFVFERDYELEDARRWNTRVPRELFFASTGVEEFPAVLAPYVDAGVLHLACNSEIRYRLRGVTVRQRAEWGQREPDGGGDAHRMTVRGEHATVVARRGPETGFRSELLVVPRDSAPGFGKRLSGRLAAWGAEWPGLSQRLSALGCELVIPAALHAPHEAHFPMVLDDFLDLLDIGDWPAALAARIRSRYAILARAQEHCAAGRD